MTLSVSTYESLDALPACYSSLFDEAASDSVYLSRPWFRALVATTADDGDRVRVYGVENKATGAADAAFIARVPRPEGQMGMRALVGFSTVYSPLFSVVSRPAANVAAMASQLATALVRERPHWDCVHLKALDPASPAFAGLERSLRAFGLIVQPYLAFGNLFEPTAGLSFKEYLARRPAAP